MVICFFLNKCVIFLLIRTMNKFSQFFFSFFRMNKFSRFGGDLKIDFLSFVTSRSTTKGSEPYNLIFFDIPCNF